MKRNGDITSFFHRKRSDQEDKADVVKDGITGKGDHAKQEAEPRKATAEEEDIDIWSKAEEVMGSDSRGKKRQSSLRLFKVIPMATFLFQFQ